MAWTWHMKSAGSLKGKSTTAETITINGISGNAITNTPEQTVEIVNKFLTIGDIQMVVDKNLAYTLGNEVTYNE